jgi:hypothetical protein
MGRVIQIDGVGKERTQLTRSVVLALRQLMQQVEVSDQTRDLAAYIALALEQISKTIDQSVEAWEKRGYWLKADRFRLDWTWAGNLGGKLRVAVLKDDWAQVATISAQIAEKLNHVAIPQRNRLGNPWEGAWKQLREAARKDGK